MPHRLFFVCCGLTSFCLLSHYLLLQLSNCANLQHQRGAVDVSSVSVCSAFGFHQVLSRCVHVCSCYCWTESRFFPLSSSKIALFSCFSFVAGVSTRKGRRLLDSFPSPADTSPPFLLPPRAVFVYDLASGWAAS